MKHFFNLSLLLLALLTSATATAHDLEYDGIYYNVVFNDDGCELTVTYKGFSPGFYPDEYSGSVTIPSSFTCNGTTYTVTSIGESAFAYCSGLTSVTIGNSVTSIGEGAFSYCSSLTSIDIPNSVTSIGYGAFGQCAGLTSLIVEGANPTYDSRNNCNAIIETASNKLIAGCQNTTIPNSVTTIGDGAFSGCIGLTSIDIPNSVITIGNKAFQNCIGLTSIDIPNSVTGIGDFAIYACYGLTSIDIPNSVTTIGFETFARCRGLTSISVASGNTIYDSRDNCNAIIETASNRLITGCMNSVIPNTVTQIGESAFSGCIGLNGITIPNSVTTIGNWAFSECYSLTEIYSLALTPPTVYSYTFNGCYSASLYVPHIALENYQEAVYWKNFTNIEGWGSAGMGDVDGDGMMNINDVTVLINALLGTIPDSFYYESADMNGNGRIDIDDVTALINNLLSGF